MRVACSLFLADHFAWLLNMPHPCALRKGINWRTTTPAALPDGILVHLRDKVRLQEFPSRACHRAGDLPRLPDMCTPDNGVHLVACSECVPVQLAYCLWLPIQ